MRARDEAQKVVDRVREELQERTAELTARTTEKDTLDAALNDARQQIEAARADTDAAHAETGAARADTEKARAETEAVRKEADAARAKAAAIRFEVDTLRAALDAAHADAAAARAETATVRSETEDARLAAETAQMALEAQLQESAAALETALAAEQSLRQKLIEVEREIESQRAEADAAAHAASLREQMARAAPQPLDRLLTIFDQLAKAMTVGDVLTALVQGLATEFPRVAAFSVGANHLEGLHQVGFDFKNDISKVVIPMTMDSFLTHAATSGRVQGFVGKELEDSNRTPFGGTPAFVLTLPIAVRGETLAVSMRGQRRSAAERRRLRSAASSSRSCCCGTRSRCCRSCRSIRRRSPRSASCATLLLTEIENMADADASDDMDAENLRSRLKDNVDCAKRLYTQRVVSDGVMTAAPLLDEQLAAIVEARAGTPFGRDLAVASRPAEPVRKTARKRA